MSTDRLKEYYEEDAERFWDPRAGMTGRDLDIYPLLEGRSGRSTGVSRDRDLS